MTSRARTPLWLRLHHVGGAFLLLLVFSTVPVQAQMPPETPERAFSEAFRLYSENLYEQAVLAFSSFRETYPQHISAPEALFYEAEASLAAGREDQAIHLFSVFQRSYPSHPLAFEARLALGKYYYATESYDRAITTLARVVADNPPEEVSARALYWMGESAMNLNNVPEALRYFEQAAIEHPNTDTAPIALYAVASALVNQIETNEAVRFFELLTARYPDSEYTQNLGLSLAEVYYEVGEYQRSVDEIQRRLPNLSPEASERATFLLAECYNQLRNSELAIVNYRKFTENNPNSPFFRHALYGLAWNYHFEEAYQWAAENFERVYRDERDELAAKAAYYHAVNLSMAGMDLDAFETFDVAARRWPNGPLADRAWYERGLAAYKLRRWEEAEVSFEKVISSYPNSSAIGDAYSYLGNTQIAIGDIDRAQASFDQAIALEAAPASLKGEVAFQKAWLMYRNDQFQQSAPAFMQIYQESPSTASGGNALFWAAESYFQVGQLERSADLFRRYIREHPDGQHNDAAYYALGWTHFRRGQYGQAITQFRTFLSQYTEQDEQVQYRTDAQLRIGDCHYALKQYPQAIQAYRRVGGTDGNDYAMFQIGQAYYNAGDSFEAVNAFSTLLQRFPESDWAEEAQYNLGYMFFQNQDYGQAIASYEQVIRNYPRAPIAAKAQYGIGDAHFNAGRYDEAVEAYKGVLENYNDSPFASDAAGSIQMALIALGDDNRANTIIEDFANETDNPELADELRFRQAEAKFQTFQYDEALVDFQRFVRSSQNERLISDAYYYMGTIYAEQGRQPEAEAYLDVILKEYPDSARRPDAMQFLGELYLDQRRDQAALNMFQQLEGVQPLSQDRFARARYGQAQALISLGRLRDAENLLTDLINSNAAGNNNGPAQLGLARVYEASQRYTDAITKYRSVVNLNQDETGAEALYRLGLLLVQQGQNRAALEELGRMPVLYSGYTDWVARGYLTQARAFINLEQTGNAVQLYDQVIEEFPGTSHAERARREKASLQ